MSNRFTQSAGAAALVAAVLTFAGDGALAKSAAQKECSEKYQAAKAANTLNGLTYNQFRKQCAAEEKGAPATAAVPAAPTTTAPTPAAAPAVPTPPAAPTPASAPAKSVAPAPAPTTTARAPAAPAPTAAGTGSAVFPTAVSASFASEKPGKAREKTCLAQYHANEASNANGGLKWTQKGGGYYSECTKRLKG